MNEAITYVDAGPVSITQAAAAKVWELMQEEDNLNLKLRVYVTGGGCYGFTFDETVNADDAVVSKILVAEALVSPPCVQVLVDSLSQSYLNGAEIDYKQDLEGEQFIIRNPNAKTTCGCGSSFTAE
jgi:iron-sulfur cluster insertion protein